jgi:Fuc2NAc and GlcNAc transferase
VERAQRGSRRIAARVSTTMGLLVLLLAGAFAALLTRLALGLARHYALVDQPDARSAHALPLPLGGGVAIALVVGAAMSAAEQRAPAGVEYWAVIALAALGIAFVGFVDDRRPLARWPRLAVQVAACLWLLIAVPGGHAMPQAMASPGGLLGAGALLVVLVWLVNLYNFMDGIDGLAAAEAAFVSLALAGILSIEGDAPAELLLVCFCIAGGSLGFLVWNWSPARIFMGDAGSGFLGFVLGAVALIAWVEGGLTPWVPAILLAVFVSDATVTLLRRMVGGEAWREPHATHAYQVMARKWSSHRRVVLVVMGMDIVWLLPLATLAALHPSIAPMLAVIAYLPVVGMVWVAGGGRRQPASAPVE